MMHGEAIKKEGVKKHDFNSFGHCEAHCCKVGGESW